MILVFIGGLTSECKVTKITKKYTYFIAERNHCKYRVENESGIVQIAPYWNKELKLKIIP